MADDFDPYVKWLGIRDPDRPPNHYRLLGLEQLEPDLDIIEMAIDRQTSYVRGQLSGAHGDIARKILSELETAKLCLLSKDKKAAYDAELTKKFGKARAAAKPQAAPAAKGTAAPKANAPAAGTSAIRAKAKPIAPSSPESESAGPAITTRAPGSKEDQHRRRKQDQTKLLMLAGGGIGLLAIVAILFAVTSGGSPKPPDKTKIADQQSEKETPDKTNDKAITQNDSAKKKVVNTSDNSPETNKKPEPTIDPPTRRVDPQLNDPASQRPPVEPPPAVNVAVGKPIDLLPGVEINSDVVAGEWRIKDGVLECTERPSSRIMMPAISLPPDYVLSMRVRRPTTQEWCKAFAIGFVMDGLPGLLALNCHDRSGLHLLDGRFWNNNESSVSGNLFQDDREHKVELTVHPSALALSVDGQPKISWQGDPSRLSVEGGWHTPAPSRLFLGANASHLIWDVQLQPLRASKWPFPNPTYSLADRNPSDAELGGWKRDGTAFQSPADKDARLSFTDKTPGGFRWSLEIEAGEGEGVIAVGFPYLGQQLVYVIDPKRPTGGLDGLDGKPFGANLSTRRISTDKKLQMDITVASPQLSVSVQGKTLFRENFAPETWRPIKLTRLDSTGGAKFQPMPDGSHYVEDAPETDSFSLEGEMPLDRMEALRLEVLPDNRLPNHGPGTHSNGNFVLTRLEVQTDSSPNVFQPARFKSVIADFHQTSFPPHNALLGNNEKSGWGVGGQAGKPHAMVVVAEQPLISRDGTRLKIRMDQIWGDHHLVGRFRWSASPNKQAALVSVHAPARLADTIDPRWKTDKPPQFFIATSGRAARLTKAELSSAGDGSSVSAIKDPSPQDLRPELADDSRIAPPGKEDLETARKLVRETFADDFARIRKNPDARSDLARQLLENSRKSKADLVEFYALLDEARAVATEAGLYPVAAEAVDALATVFDVDRLQLRSTALLEAAKKAKSPADCEAAGHAALDIYDELLEANRLDAIDPILKAGQSLAQRAKSPDLAASVKERLAQFVEDKRRLQALEQHYATLKEKPDDPDANLAVGKYRCFVRDDWTQGLPMLFKGSDDQLKQLATSENAKPTNAAEQAKLAEAWRTFGEKPTGNTTADRVGAVNRALHWYALAIPRLTGLEKVKADSAIEQLQNLLSKWTRAPRVLELKLADKVTLKMKLIPAGKFIMGDRRFGPPHPVQISKPFYLGIYELTNAQWNAVMSNTFNTGGNPGMTQPPNLPKGATSWVDSQAFLEKLNQLPAGRGYRFRLPTEAEWEYACRAGTTTRNFWGDDDRQGDDYCWHGTNSGNVPHPVGEKRPNPWGLYDMMGNVHEWCSDWYDNTYYSRSPLVDPKGPESGTRRASRGLSVFRTHDLPNTYAARRQEFDTGFRAFDFGFRVAADRK